MGNQAEDSADPEGSAELSALVAEALARHREGQLAQAGAIYLRVLERDPDHFDALHLLGVTALQGGRPQEAMGLIARALEMNPRVAPAQVNMGIALRTLGRAEDSLAHHDAALALVPDYAGAHVQRGAALNDLGRFEEALASQDQALLARPDFVESHMNRGVALYRLKRLGPALAAFDTALALKPDFAETHLKRAVVLYDLDRKVEALAGFETAIALDPALARAHAYRAGALSDLGRSEEAVAACDRALGLEPENPEALNNRANALIKLERRAEALADLDRLIALRPRFGLAYAARGLALYDSDRLDEALASVDRWIALDGDSVVAWKNRGAILTRQKRYDESLENFERALALDPDDADAMWGKALILMRRGDYDAAAEPYEVRFRMAFQPADLPNFDRPRWSGQALDGKRVFIHGEQGLGDVIQFSRYAKPLIAQGAKVLMGAPPELTAVLATLDPALEFTPVGQIPDDYDYETPLLSLPWIFTRSEETVLAYPAYLRADPARIEAWAARLGPRARPRVGLVWAGGHRADRPDLWLTNRQRNAPLRALAPLAGLGAEFISLQKGETAEAELAALTPGDWPGPPIRDLTGEIADFADTAALASLLDLVISVDTSTAHLVGALGKPVWILNRYNGCWRWLEDRQDSPWYPSARLFNQDETRLWAPVIAEVRSALEAWLAART